MDKEVLGYVVEKTKELIAAATCSSETREAAQAWLDAVGTEEMCIRDRAVHSEKDV